jgi:hypothetical protein
VHYFHCTVRNCEGEAYLLLSRLADLGVNLLAFDAVPTGPASAHLTLFPEDDAALEKAAEKAGLTLEGPHTALLAKGDDELGALAKVHEKLFAAKVNVFASHCVTDGHGCYCYLLYVRPKEYDAAARALGIQ